MLRFAPWKVASILALVLAAVFLIIPTFLPAKQAAGWQRHLPSFIPVRPITLGLDLQGGAHVLLEVDGPSIVKGQVGSLRDDVRAKLRELKVPYPPGGLANLPRGVMLRYADANDRARAVTALKTLDLPVGGVLSGAVGHSLDILDQGDQGLQLILTEAATREKMHHAVTQSIEVLNKRVNELGTKETNIQQQGLTGILVEVPGLQDTRKLMDLLQANAKLEFRLVAQPSDPPNEVEQLPNEKGGGTVPVQKQVMVSGEDLVDAQQGFEQQGGEAVVNFKFNLRGGQKFGQVTAENVNRPFAIVLDGKVISAPVIRSPILGGQGQISGGFTVQAASDLSALLRAGALPAKLEKVEEHTVGPGLGQDSINAGKLAAVVGGILVVVYMLTTYGIFGVFADLALAVHILFIFASMALIGATLTLPGIAGVVFTIGMAVDSNVLIYERIREESHMGRSVISALDAGFNRAFATIIDSNVTMFVAAVILFLFGSGAVRGFAVSLGLGILTSVITAVTMTRMMIALWFRLTRPKTIPI